MSSKDDDDENAGTEIDEAGVLERFRRTLKRMLETPPDSQGKTEQSDDRQSLSSSD